MSLTFANSTLDRPAIILPIALLLLAAAGGVMWSNLASRDRAVAAAPPASKASAVTVAVLTSTTDIARGQILSPQNVSLRLVDPSTTPAASLHRLEDGQDHMALASIPAGAPILTGQISADAVTGLSARIPPSYRAYAVPVSEADIAGGFVQAGDLVDLFVTLPGALFAGTEGGKLNDRSKATLLLQSVRVLAVGTKRKRDGEATPAVRTVTLALSATDLSKVALAARLGTITFGIRNPVDDTAQPATRAELSNLLGEKPASAAPAGLANIRQPEKGVAFYSGRDRYTLHAP